MSSEFKLGKRVRCTYGVKLSPGPKTGKEYTVTAVTDQGQGEVFIGVEEGDSEGKWNVTRFELIENPYPKPPHKHAEIIKAWADGAIIERFSKMQDAWVCATSSPAFQLNTEYRLAADQRTEKQRVLDDKIAAAKETLAKLEDERKSL